MYNMCRYTARYRIYDKHNYNIAIAMTTKSNKKKNWHYSYFLLDI